MKRAHDLVDLAKSRDDLPRARYYLCVDCRCAADRWEHRDYFKPLTLVPVCIICNAMRRNVWTLKHNLRRLAAFARSVLRAATPDTIPAPHVSVWDGARNRALIGRDAVKRTPREVLDAAMKRGGALVMTAQPIIEPPRREPKQPRGRRPCGTRSAYTGGCRCEPCTTANREYSQRRAVPRA